MTKSERVAILGASKNPERYSYTAFKMLREYGHTPLLVTPKFSELEGFKAYARLADVPGPVDTLTIYVGPERSSQLLTEIVQLKPGRVIFNPGSENPEVQEALKQADI